MWFKRKTKDEKEQELQKKEQELQTELIQLRDKYADVIDSYCKIGNFIFILKGFTIDDDRIVVHFIDKDVVDGYVNYMELYWFGRKYGHVDFTTARYQFMRLKEDLKKLGLKLEKI